LVDSVNALSTKLNALKIIPARRLLHDPFGRPYDDDMMMSMTYDEKGRWRKTLTTTTTSATTT